MAAPRAPRHRSLRARRDARLPTGAVPGGWPPKLTAEKKVAGLAMRDRGDVTMSEIARALGVGRTILYDHLDLPPLDDIPREDADDELAA